MSRSVLGSSGFFSVLTAKEKTTLLRAILGLIRPQAGQLWVHPGLGQRECIGFVPQRCDINPTLPTTVREFVLLGLVGIHTDRNDEALRLAWALDKVGLSELGEKITGPCREASGSGRWSPVPWCAGRVFSCSTNLPMASTSQPRMQCCAVLPSCVARTTKPCYS